MTNTYNNVALRALNHSKTLNPIIYLAVRCFFEKLPYKSVPHGLFEDLFKRKLLVRKNWITKENKLFKEKLGEDYIYRDILSLSAFGVIAESFLMRSFTEDECFINKKNIYSYLLPDTKKSTRNYQYYFNGYKKRNEEITKCFKEHKDSIALVLDLTKFYPSINKLKAKETFLQKLENNTDIYALSEKLVNSILSQSSQGVPIGPDLSHLIAQMYLESFDNQMSIEFPDKYFRYVDDIVIICTPEKQTEVIDFVKKILPDELLINESKTDILCFSDWNILNVSNDKENENFNDLLNFITAFISMHPLKIDDLEKALNTHGYNIPLRRIKKQSKSKNFMKYISYLLNNTSRFSTFEIYYTKPEYIIQKLTSLKDFYLDRFNVLSQLSYSNDNSTQNRSNTQQLKFILNRLLYLCTLEELTALLSKIPETDKFLDTKEVIVALISKNLINTIKFGGKVVQTVCELWKEYNLKTLHLSRSDFDKFSNMNDVLDSIIIMYLYKIIDFDINEILIYLSDINKDYISVILDETFIPEHNITDEYILELYGLFKYMSLDKKNELLFTRYDNDEGIQLAGLDLGIGYSL